MSKWNEADTARETGDSVPKVHEAFHDARESAAKSGDLIERNVNKTSHKVDDSSFGSILKGFFWGK